MTIRQPFATWMIRGLAAVAALGIPLAAGRDGRAAVQAGRLAGIAGAANTGVQVQNLDPTRSATVLRDVAQYGSPIKGIHVSRPQIRPASADNMYMPAVAELTDGVYAMILGADRPIAAIARTDWTTSGGAATYSGVTPGMDVFLPLALIRFYGQTSLVAVQNTDFDHAATIHVALIANGQAAPAAERDYTIEPGSGVALDLAAEFAGVPANTPGGFLGSLRVTSPVPVGMMSFVDIATGRKAVYAFEGGPASAGGRTLYAPLVRSRQVVSGANEFSTGIAIANPGATAVSATVTYRGSYKACAGQTYRDGPVTIPPFSSTVFYQPASKSLPSDCVATAVIEADGDVFAIVNDSLNLTEQAAAYNAVPASQGATIVHLPLVRRKHTAMALSTGIQVMNVGTAVANVKIRFFDNTGVELISCGTACDVSVQPLAAASFFPSRALNAMPIGSYGSAVVTSDQPVVVIVNDASETGAIDMATYNGIKGDGGVPSEPSTPNLVFVTFAARNWVKPGTSGD